MSGRWWKAPEMAFLDRRLQKLPASLFRLWFNLNCLRSWAGGAMPPLEDAAFLLRTSAKALSRRLDALRLAGLVEMGEGGEIAIVGGIDAEPRAHDDRAAPMSAAERQRAWRERKRAGRVTAGETPTVTAETAIEREREQRDEDSSRVTRGERDEGFEQFLAAYPQRDEPTARAPALAAFRKAIGDGADPAALIEAARAYAAATAGRERRFVASAVRWLGEARWKDDAPKAVTPPAAAPLGVWIEQGTAAWAAWSDHWRETKGKTPPIDGRNGWRFPSALPPAALVEAAA